MNACQKFSTEDASQYIENKVLRCATSRAEDLRSFAIESRTVELYRETCFELTNYDYALRAVRLQMVSRHFHGSLGKRLLALYAVEPGGHQEATINNAN